MGKGEGSKRGWGRGEREGEGARGNGEEGKGARGDGEEGKGGGGGGSKRGWGRGEGRGREQVGIPLPSAFPLLPSPLPSAPFLPSLCSLLPFPLLPSPLPSAPFSPSLCSLPPSLCSLPLPSAPFPPSLCSLPPFPLLPSPFPLLPSPLPSAPFPLPSAPFPPSLCSLPPSLCSLLPFPLLPSSLPLFPKGVVAKLCSVARPPTESTPPLAYLVRSLTTLYALDIERTCNTAQEEETNWSLQAAGVFPPYTTHNRAPRVHSINGRLAHPDQLALEAYFASYSHRQCL